MSNSDIYCTRPRKTEEGYVVNLYIAQYKAAEVVLSTEEHAEQLRLSLGHWETLNAAA